MKLYHFPVADKRLPHEIFAPLSAQPYSLFLDSADTRHELSRYSFITYHPFETIEARDGRVTVTNREQQFTFTADPFAILAERLETYGLNHEDRPAHKILPPFRGGAAGYFGYDLARSLETLPATAQSGTTPDMAIGLYNRVYAFDHKTGDAVFMTYAVNETDAEAQYKHFMTLVAAPYEAGTSTGMINWRASHSPESYGATVKKVIDYIYDGDIFQANLSQRFDADLPAGFDSYGHYLTLRSVNPAPFASYMNFGSLRLASASPERFLQLRHRTVETRPIKGTQKRINDNCIDRLYRNGLENSEKDRAENTMIVDLLRNDLSKSCEDHSIDVPELCKLESFAKVHHLVSTVTGTLRADKTPVDLLRGCFPGGSITGAPKVRAMEIIEELEDTRRGPYCGALGYIGFHGAMDTNIAIRTLVYEGDRVSFCAGGGITALSKPADEYEETLAKAKAIFESFEVKDMSREKRIARQ